MSDPGRPGSQPQPEVGPFPGAALSRAHLDFLLSVDSPTIANAIERFDVRDRTEGYIGGTVRCLFPALGPMVGQAVTVRMTSRRGPAASLDGYWRMWEVLAAAPSPSVLVVQDVSGAPTRCAYVGEVMATLANRLGCVGFVTDGGVRDVGETEALGFHVFSTQVVVSHGNFEILDVDSDVTLDGQVVRSGDILHGDRNGIVIVPQDVLEELRSAAAAIRANEAEFMEYIGSSEFTVAEAKRRAGY
jgi:4-hydroxy-4-methyl-2-oxoglutarate aldolase